MSKEQNNIQVGNPGVKGGIGCSLIILALAVLIFVMLIPGYSPEIIKIIQAFK